MQRQVSAQQELEVVQAMPGLLKLLTDLIQLLVHQGHKTQTSMGWVHMWQVGHLS
jgi:hypothetical protein